MELFSQAIMFLGLIFDMIVLLFIVLSVLLIYSLLMISVESKSFEYGVMRMQGLSKSGLIYMIVLQSVMFVLPSLLIGFMVSIPTLAGINEVLFDTTIGVDKSPLPSSFAVTQALIVGLIIPFISSVISLLTKILRA